ncbi:hypothetical protein TWF481_000059 [Arthrobotrys musiformis]|uniref:Uncharacterized protein n=1 Tax=Arthrobotrys musiformis TaxID=47236 RepID=A0AAV9WNH6_9PEZI
MQVKVEEEESKYLPTPPPSEPGIDPDTKENEEDNNIQEDTKTLTTITPDPQKPPTKKRGRPKATAEKPTPAPKKPKSEPSSAAPTDATKSKRGRQPGSSAADTFTKEQDAYIRELYTSPTKHSSKEIYSLFEEKFNTGKSSNVIRFRWYKLKEGDIVLSAEEETALKKAIETVENNKALAVLNEYGNAGDGEYTKLSQGFVIKRMKDWSAGIPSSNSKSKGQVKKEEDNEEDGED